MRYRRLGQSGLFVSELCLGTMTFGGSDDVWGQIGQLQQEAANDLVRTALDAGVNFFDTANVYAGGNSEKILGQSLKDIGANRDEVVIATKVHGQMGDGPNARGTSRYHILGQVEASLERLQVDHIDLYQIHGFDPATPIEETLDALDRLVSKGTIRYYGLSNWAAWQVMKAIGIAAAKNLPNIVSLQAYYTLAGRDLEREIAPMLLSEGVGLMVWSPLAGGFLSGKFDRKGKPAEGRRVNFDFPPLNKERAYAVIEAMRELARDIGCTVPQIAIAWLLHQKVVTSVIVGAKRIDQLSETLGSVNVSLSNDHLSALAAVTELSPEYPGWMLAFQNEYRSKLMEDQLR